MAYAKKMSPLSLLAYGVGGVYVLNHWNGVRRVLKSVAKTLIHELSRQEELESSNTQIEKMLKELRSGEYRSSHVTVSTSSGFPGKFTGAVLLTGGLGIYYLYHKGFKYEDVMYVTQSVFNRAISVLQSSFDTLNDKVASLRMEFLSRFDSVSHQMDAQNEEIRDTIKSEVRVVAESVDEIMEDLSRTRQDVSHVRTQFDTINEKVDISAQGISLLLECIANCDGLVRDHSLQQQLRQYLASYSIHRPLAQNLSPSFHPLCQMGLRDSRFLLPSSKLQDNSRVTNKTFQPSLGLSYLVKYPHRN